MNECYTARLNKYNVFNNLPRKTMPSLHQPNTWFWVQVIYVLTFVLFSVFPGVIELLHKCCPHYWLNHSSSVQYQWKRYQLKTVEPDLREHSNEFLKQFIQTHISRCKGEYHYTSVRESFCSVSSEQHKHIHSLFHHVTYCDCLFIYSIMMSLWYREQVLHWLKSCDFVNKKVKPPESRDQVHFPQCNTKTNFRSPLLQIPTSVITLMTSWVHF